MQTDTRSAPFQDEEMHEVARRANDIAANIASVILGKEEVIQACVVALLAGGHLIIEDYPGVGKTLLAKALARSVNCRFARIQFTPDLLPSDVTGVSVFNQKTAGFEFRPGPIFANIVLADEINRSSPKTQASLLECMEERQATIDNVTHAIVAPFMVIATQNPIEYEGTYPLPEAQLDRFMMRISIGYPAAEAEDAILQAQTSGDPFAELAPVLGDGEVLAMQAALDRVKVAPAIRRYVVDILAATREQQGRLPRGQPSRRDRPRARGQGPGRAAGQGFRRPAGHQGPRRPGAQSQDHPLARCEGPRAVRRSGARRPAQGRPRAGTGAMTRPTARGLSLLVVAMATYLAARILGTWELYLLSFAFVAALFVSWVLVLVSGRRLRVVRVLTPEQPVVGDPLLLSFRVKNGSLLPGLQVRLPHAVGDLGDRDRAVDFESLGPRAERVATSGPWPARRGVHRLPALLAEAEDPLGLVRVRRRLGDAIEFTVFPRLTHLRSCALLVGAGQRREVGRGGLAALGGYEFRGIRPHNPGEPLSHVDWKSTAKTGNLMLRETEDPASSDVTLLLEGAASFVVGEPPDTNFELAVEVAGSIAAFALRAGRGVSLLLHERDWGAAAPHGRRRRSPSPAGEPGEGRAASFRAARPLAPRAPR